MALYITSINSGSNGNCYYVGNQSEAVLVDAGLSCKETETRMKRLGLSMEKVKAVFISHEHTDHIRGVEVLSRKYKLPIYITEATRRQGRVKLEKDLSKSFCANEQVLIGNLAVTAFSKHHDAADPYSFTVTGNEVTVGIFTDIGTPCQQLIHHFKQCHAAFLEANYDNDMLEKGDYPYYLKSRIRGGQGHLSNAQALELFNTHRSPFMSHLILSHLSKNNNCPRLVQDLFDQHAGDVNMIVASRYGESPLFEISSIGSTHAAIKVMPKSAEQMVISFD
jgi:phosphoribosyl 1,2-cyclic phosphodiesterase